MTNYPHLKRCPICQEWCGDYTDRMNRQQFVCEEHGLFLDPEMIK